MCNVTVTSARCDFIDVNISLRYQVRDVYVTRNVVNWPVWLVLTCKVACPKSWRSVHINFAKVTIKTSGVFLFGHDVLARDILKDKMCICDTGSICRLHSYTNDAINEWLATLQDSLTCNTSLLSFLTSAANSSVCWTYCHLDWRSVSKICSRWRCFCSSCSFCSSNLLKLNITDNISLIVFATVPASLIGCSR